VLLSQVVALLVFNATNLVVIRVGVAEVKVSGEEQDYEHNSHDENESGDNSGCGEELVEMTEHEVLLHRLVTAGVRRTSLHHSQVTVTESAGKRHFVYPLYYGGFLFPS
jgi:hypothetical protein